MLGTGDDGMMAREIGNVRFLIEQQIQVVADLERRGLDGRAAQDLLRRLRPAAPPRRGRRLPGGVTPGRCESRRGAPI